MKGEAAQVKEKKPKKPVAKSMMVTFPEYPQKRLYSSSKEKSAYQRYYKTTQTNDRLKRGQRTYMTGESRILPTYRSIKDIKSLCFLTAILILPSCSSSSRIGPNSAMILIR
jgi:hypothetical protein